MADFYGGTLSLQDSTGTEIASLTGDSAVVAHDQFQSGATRLTVVDPTTGEQTTYLVGDGAGCVCRVVFTPEVDTIPDRDCEEVTC